MKYLKQRWKIGQLSVRPKSDIEKTYVMKLFKSPVLKHWSYLADFIVIEKDLLTIPPEQIPETSIAQTWLAGEKVYTK